MLTLNLFSQQWLCSVIPNSISRLLMSMNTRCENKQACEKLQWHDKYYILLALFNLYLSRASIEICSSLQGQYCLVWPVSS